MKGIKGVCHECKSEEIEYGISEIVDDLLYYEYECTECNHEGKEWYKLKYLETD